MSQPHAVNHLDSQQTVARFLEDWLDEIRPQLRPPSYSVYQIAVEKHLIPALGILPLTQINELDGERLLQELFAKGLSERSINDIARKLQQAINWGARQKRCRPIKLVTRIEISRQNDPRYLSPEEKSQLTEFLMREADPSRLGILLVLYAGLSIGELCALTWSDLDFSAQTVSVNKVAQRHSESGGSKFALLPIEPRLVPVPCWLLKAFSQLENAKSGSLIPGVKVDFAEPRTMQQRLKRHLAECGLDTTIVFGDLRDTFIKNCMESQIDFILVSKMVGCSDLNELWKKYGKFYRQAG